MLSHTEYVEQAYLFDLLRNRIAEATPIQELLDQFKDELLATTRLPMAIDYMLTELRHSGMMSPAMKNLPHYFTPFQTFLVSEAEREGGRFSMPIALQVLHFDAKQRADYALAIESTDSIDALVQKLGSEKNVVNGNHGPRFVVPDVSSTVHAMVQRARSGFFFFQFECLCRNRLGYDAGLTAMAGDPVFDDAWAAWLLKLRAELGLIDLADLIFLTSEDFVRRSRQQPLGRLPEEPSSLQVEPLFGEKEGRIAFANRRKDPLYLFGAMQRHLNYPPVPRPVRLEEDRDTIPQLLRRIERLETRIKIMEQEQKQEFDITKFYKKPEG